MITNFLTHVFYFSTLFFLYQELRWIYSPKEMAESSKKFSELSKLNKEKKWNEFSSEYKNEIKNKVPLIFILIWEFIGLFTFQWATFLIMIVFNFLIVAPILKLTKFSIVYTIFNWLNAVVGFIFGIFVILNHYHLHLDVWQMIKTIAW